jgi:hypothetical protein
MSDNNIGAIIMITLVYAKTLSTARAYCRDQEATHLPRDTEGFARKGVERNVDIVVLDDLDFINKAYGMGKAPKKAAKKKAKKK